MNATDVSSVDLAQLRRYEADGWLKSQRHPTLPLTIWNYTPACQYGRHWDDVTIMCRGLVTTDDGQIVARPFEKFFNLGEYEEVTGKRIPDRPFEVYEKLDGSLIIAFRYGDELIVTSRGSFVSSQARWAEQKIRAFDGADRRIATGKHAGEFTYLFEAIYPENRIVVDYGPREDLVLLAVIRTADGAELLPIPHVGFPVARQIEHCGGFENLPQNPNEEGYVVRFEYGPRVKIKTEEYVRLHRLLTSTSPRTIWESMRDGVPLSDFLQNVPDEFYQWVESVHRTILQRVDDILSEIHDADLDLDSRVPRGEVAAEIARKLPAYLRPLAFLLLDGKDPQPYLWKLVKPSSSDAELAYKAVTEDLA